MLTQEKPITFLLQATKILGCLAKLPDPLDESERTTIRRFGKTLCGIVRAETSHDDLVPTSLAIELKEEIEIVISALRSAPLEPKRMLWQMIGICLAIADDIDIDSMSLDELRNVLIAIDRN